MIQMTLTPQLANTIVGARHRAATSTAVGAHGSHGPIVDDRVAGGVVVHPLATSNMACRGMAYRGIGNGTGATNATGTKHFTSTKWTTRHLGVRTT